VYNNSVVQYYNDNIIITMQRIIMTAQKSGEKTHNRWRMLNILRIIKRRRRRH